MTKASQTELRSRLYEPYDSQHADVGGGEAVAPVYRRGIRPLLPPPEAGPIVDLGCGRGELDRFPQADGFDAEGIDVGPEQAALAGFVSVLTRSSPPVAHGLVRVGRVMAWQVVSACYRIALAAETGMLRGQTVTQNLTFAAGKDVVTMKPAES